MMSIIDTIVNADASTFLKTLPDNYINCVVTSPPYYALRDYGVDGQIGLEETPAEFVAKLVAVFREVRRVLREDGVCWVNMGDSYASGEIGRHDSVDGRAIDGKHVSQKFNSRQQSTIGTNLPPKNRLGMPHRLVFALQDDGWIWRDEIIWHKPNPMPESVTDRTTKAHEYVFMLTKRPRYWYDADAIREEAASDITRREFRGGGAYTSSQSFINNADIPNKTKGNTAGIGIRNRRSVFTVPTEPTPFAHFATYPQALIEPLILAGCPKGGIVYDPFMGSGTTALVARRLGRHYLGSELNSEYHKLATDRLLLDDTTLRITRQAGVQQLSMFDAEVS